LDWAVKWIVSPCVTFDVHVEVIMMLVESVTASPQLVRVIPNNLVSESFHSKDAVCNNLCIVTDIPIQVNEYRPVFGKQFEEYYASLIEPARISIQLSDSSSSILGAYSPSISVGFLFDHRWFLDKRLWFVVCSIRIVWNIRSVRDRKSVG